MNGNTLTDDGNFVDDNKTYKPDQVYQRGKKTWIVEIEASTSRKGFIGGYLKAQKYLHDNNKQGGLLFIIQEKSIKNLSAIAKQLSQYDRWLYDQSIPVEPTYLIHDTKLNDLISSKVTLLSRDFFKQTQRIDK